MTRETAAAAVPPEAPADPGLVAAAAAVDALAAAFGAYQLYPTPADQPVFVRSLEALHGLDRFPLEIEIGAGTFSYGGALVPAEREGAERLAKLMFVHDMAEIRILGRPEAQDVVTMFDILSTDEEVAGDAGGAHMLLEAAAVASIRLVHRFATLEEDEEEEPERDDEVVEVIDLATRPREFAEALIAEAGGDPNALADRFHAWYLTVYAKVERPDVVGREEIVQAFVEAFFYLPRPFQVPLVARFLRDKDDHPCQVFLDQFAGHELAGLATDLAGDSRTQLLEYARIAADSAAGRPEELLALLQSASEVKEARMAVARRVERLIRGDAAEQVSSGEWVENLRSQVPGPEGDFDAGLGVLRDLFATETRDDRFRRLLRIWSGRVGMAIRRGDLERAEAWINGILDDPPVGPERRQSLEAALSDMATPNLLEKLVGYLDADDPAANPAALRLLEAWGRPVARKLVERLAAEEDPNRRRLLIDVLGSIARIDAEPLLAYLADARWYVVRNLAMILGRSGRSQVAPHVRQLMNHADHRVRVEALRALPPLIGDAAVDTILGSLNDRHPRVRQAGLALLRTSEHPRVDEALGGRFRTSKDSDELERVGDVLAARRSSSARALLEQCASKRFALSGAARARRDAARRALRRKR